MTMNARELAQKAASVADAKKAEDVLILNVQGLSFITDYFVIASAKNSALVKAIADELENKLGEAGVPCSHKEGYSDARWILMDFGDVVAHIFLESERDFYNLEQLWADAPSETFKGTEDGE